MLAEMPLPYAIVYEPSLSQLSSALSHKVALHVVVAFVAVPDIRLTEAGAAIMLTALSWIVAAVGLDGCNTALLVPIDEDGHKLVTGAAKNKWWWKKKFHH